MRLFIYSVFIIVLICIGRLAASAQVEKSFNRIPLNKKIHVELLGADKNVLSCYNIYGFAYVTPSDSSIGEFVVLKDADTFVNKYETDIKLCRIREFAINAGGKCRHIKVDVGVQLKYPDMAEEVFLNFDPEGPSPVFIPCK